MADLKSSYSAADSIPIKLIKNYELMHSMMNDGIILPIHVQFIPTNRCNLKCLFCSCANDDRKTEMSLKDARKLIEIMKNLGTRSVTITGGGEPLLHPHFSEIIKAFNEADIEVGLVCHGLELRCDSPLEEIVWCRISNADHRSLTGKYLKRLNDVVETFPNIDWAFSHVVSADPNFNEIHRIIEFANLHNFTHVRIVADLLNYHNVNLGIVEKAMKNRGIDDSLVIYQGRNKPTKGGDCYICYLKPIIGADCKVYTCCLDENEPILIQRKEEKLYIPIKDVVPGDYACEYGEILNVFYKEGEEGLEIVLRNNRTIYVSNDHIMLKLADPQIKHKRKKLLSDYNLNEIESFKLKIGDLLPVKYRYDNIKNKDKISSIEAEFIGYYNAEGWSSDRITLVKKKYPTRNTSINFMFGKSEKKYIKRFEEICDILGFKYSVRERKTGIQYTIYVHTSYDKLIAHCGNKSHLKKIPSFILNGSKNIKWKFIERYFEGDGSLQKPSKAYSGYKMKMSTVSRQLANDLIYLFSTLGIQASLRIERRAGESVIEGRKVNIRDRYHVNIGGAYNLIKIPFLNIKQIKKRSPQRALGFLKDEKRGIMFVPIKEIRKKKIKNLVDIQVKDSNKFISSFGIIVHNCGAQYALKIPTRKMPPELCMGSAFDLEKMIKNSHKPFDGSICYRCYYDNYNKILESILAKTEHMNFV